eukprot:3252008-Pleurochrysis_carterae.AAC.1
MKSHLAIRLKRTHRSNLSRAHSIEGKLPRHRVCGHRYRYRRLRARVRRNTNPHVRLDGSNRCSSSFTAWSGSKLRGRRKHAWTRATSRSRVLDGRPSMILRRLQFLLLPNCVKCTPHLVEHGRRQWWRALVGSGGHEVRLSSDKIA